MEKPNIILIQTDQQSATTLGLYGNPVVKTPVLERLAEEGILFNYAYCNYPACSPSRSSMMTGRYPSTIRVHANHMLINPQEVTMPRVFKDAGYQTALIGKNHAFLTGENYYPEAGDSMKRGYNELEKNFDYIFQGGHINVDGMEDDQELKASIEWARDTSWGEQHNAAVNPYPCEKSVTQRLADNVIEYLDKERDTEKPFFMWFSIPDPHTPDQVSEPYASMYDPEQIPSPIYDELDNKPERQKVAHLLDFNHKYNEEHFKKVRAIHYGMINQIDDNLGRVFKSLEEQGLKEDTIIVFTSDHGDAMGDHGIIQKHNCFYDSFTRVPFIISWPGKIKPQRTDNLVELVDIMPTLLELVGIEIPYGVQGQSIVPFLTGKENETKEYVVIESGEAGTSMEVKDVLDEDREVIDKGTSFAWCAFREAWTGRGKCIRTNGWKLAIYTNGEGELYDLENDPDELENLFENKEYSEIKNELTYKLLLWSMENDDKIPLNKTVNKKLHYYNGSEE